MNPVRAVIESTYEDVCNVYEYKQTTDPITNITKPAETLMLGNQRCRISYKTINPTGSGETATATQSVKLFIAPDADIKPGSKIVIAHCGRNMEYSNSGIPAIYDSHQEIMLVPFRGWA